MKVKIHILLVAVVRREVKIKKQSKKPPLFFCGWVPLPMYLGEILKKEVILWNLQKTHPDSFSLYLVLFCVIPDSLPCSDLERGFGSKGDLQLKRFIRTKGVWRYLRSAGSFARITAGRSRRTGNTPIILWFWVTLFSGYRSNLQTSLLLKGSQKAWKVPRIFHPTPLRKRVRISDLVFLGQQPHNYTVSEGALLWNKPRLPLRVRKVQCILSDKLPGKSGSAERARKLFGADLLVTKGLGYKKEHHLRIGVMLLFLMKRSKQLSNLPFLCTLCNYVFRIALHWMNHLQKLFSLRIVKQLVITITSVYHKIIKFYPLKYHIYNI